MIDKRQTYFQILGIPPTEDLNEIKKAYRKKAMLFHPDKNPSKNAQERFIEITEAYESLIDPPKMATASAIKTTAEAKAEKVRKAKERYQQMQRAEQNREALYYKKITTGLHWKVFKILAYHCLALTVFLSIDFFIPRSSHSTNNISGFPHIAKAIAIDEEIFIINEQSLWSDVFPPLRKNYSLLFNDLRSVEVITDYVDIQTSTFPSSRNNRYQLFNNFNTTKFYNYSSTYYLFPYFHFFLLIPIILVWYKRPNFTFSLWRMVSIWLFFPVALFLTFSGGRIIQLFIW